MVQKQIIPPKPSPNIALAKGAAPATVDGTVHMPKGNPIILPDEPTQRKGWYHPRAEEIITLYPDRYKPVTDKGE